MDFLVVASDKTYSSTYSINTTTTTSRSFVNVKKSSYVNIKTETDSSHKSQFEYQNSSFRLIETKKDSYNTTLTRTITTGYNGVMSSEKTVYDTTGYSGSTSSDNGYWKYTYQGTSTYGRSTYRGTLTSYINVVTKTYYSGTLGFTATRTNVDYAHTINHTTDEASGRGTATQRFLRDDCTNSSSATKNKSVTVYSYDYGYEYQGIYRNSYCKNNY